MFHQHGYHVEATASVEEAQGRLDEQRPPTALVSDVRLDPFSGLHLAMLAAHLPFTVSVLLDEDYDNMRQSQAMQFWALYVVKPIDHAELARYVAFHAKAALGNWLPSLPSPRS